LKHLRGISIATFAIGLVLTSTIVITAVGSRHIALGQEECRHTNLSLHIEVIPTVPQWPYISVARWSGILLCDNGEPVSWAPINVKVTGNGHTVEADETADDDGFYYGGFEFIPGTYTAQSFYPGDPSAGIEPTQSPVVKFTVSRP
jgi:hypothetical protein